MSLDGDPDIGWIEEVHPQRPSALLREECPPLGGSRDRRHLVPSRDEQGDDTPPDDARRASHEDPHDTLEWIYPATVALRRVCAMKPSITVPSSPGTSSATKCPLFSNIRTVACGNASRQRAR